jgi:Holliday junction resolvase RusA-like endonuclease
LKSIKEKVNGIPYGHDKVMGDLNAPRVWTDRIIEKTASLEKVNCPCILRVTFHLPQDKFPSNLPYGNDIDNLLKRFCDALGQTIFSEAPGKDSVIISIEATKVKAKQDSDAGAEFEIIIINHLTTG